MTGSTPNTITAPSPGASRDPVHRLHRRRCRPSSTPSTPGLADFAETVPVGTVLNGAPECYRILGRLSGGRETVASDAFGIILEAWAGSEQRAARLLNIGRAILLAQDHTPLFGVREDAGPANLPDPTVPDRVRYTASLTVRARAAQTA
jgi:hypothetical protein